MDDGGQTPYGFNLHTKSFTFAEVYMLAGMLHYQFGLVTIVQDYVGQPVIYIPAASLDIFKAIVAPHFHSQMLYKIKYISSPLTGKSECKSLYMLESPKVSWY